MAAEDPSRSPPVLAKSGRGRKKSRSEKARAARKKSRLEMGKTAFKLVLLGILFCAFYITLFSGGQPPVPVSGVVLYKGQPVANVNVICLGKRTATGTTDDQGRFKELTTSHPGDGVYPGEYQVAIAPPPSAETSAVNAYDLPPTPSFPARYLSADTSGLRISVEKNGENHFRLQLED